MLIDMRYWALGVLAALGCSDDGAPALPDASPVGHLSIQGACAQPLAADGAVQFAATAITVQTTHRVIDVTNDGGLVFQVREQLDWTIRGPDAAEFKVVAGEENAIDDPGRCTHQETPPGSFPIGGTCHFAIDFRPTTLGAKQATLHVQDRSDPSFQQDFPIHATAVAVPTTVYASTTDLYLSPPSSTAPNILIVNPMATSVDLGTPVVAAPFMFTGWSCQSPLAAGSVCSVTVSYPGGQSTGCPTGAFATTTSAIQVPLSARGSRASTTALLRRNP